MKLKKLFALTLSLGLGVSLASCGKEKENKNDTTTTTSEVSSSTSVESSTNTSTNASTSTSTSSQTSTTTSGEVDNEWKIITFEEFIDYLTTVEKPTYNWGYGHGFNFFGNEVYFEIKIEDNKFYQSKVHEKDIDIYNIEYEWQEFNPYEFGFILTKEMMENSWSAEAVVKDNGHYELTITTPSSETINTDLVLMKNNNYFKMESTTSDVTNISLYNEYGYVLSDKDREITWDTVDLTRINGHIVTEK